MPMPIPQQYINILQASYKDLYQIETAHNKIQGSTDL